MRTLFLTQTLMRVNGLSCKIPKERYTFTQNMDFKRFYITTSIPYVNAKPHIGHTLEFAQVDAIGRYWRAKLGAENVRTQTGTDENSLKNVRAAEDAGEPVADFVARHAEVFKSLQQTLNLQIDDFIRTREDRHMKGAQKLWLTCNPEDIYKKSYKGLYCVGCETFYTEKDIPDGNCPIHKKPVEIVEEENYFFKLSNYQEQIERLIETDEIKITPATRKNEILSFVKQGLEDFSISRSQERAKHWGVPVPGDESQVMYVWFDALSNYITALGFADNAQAFSNFWQNTQTRTVHVIGKDILRFHAVYWPAMLLSAGVALPKEIFVHGFITAEGEKISKSLGNVVYPEDLTAEFGIDAVRYYLLREIPPFGDGDFSRTRMESRYSELANTLGNLVSRVAAMSQKYFEGKLDRINPNWDKQNAMLEEHVRGYDMRGYLDIVFEAAQTANEIIDRKAPFKLVKTDEAEAKRVLSEVAEIIRWIGHSLQPCLPQTAEKILAQYSDDGVVTTGDILFPRRDQKEA